MVRTPYCDKSGMKKGTWTIEEDRKLIAYVTKYGCWNWRQLPKYAGLSRCGKSCRLRWLNYLRPNVKRGNYTKEEEDAIIQLHESLGNRWSAIAAHLPGRTDNDIKNHWHSYLKKRSKVVPKSISHQQSTNTYDKHEDNINIVREKHEQVAESTNNIATTSSPLSLQTEVISSARTTAPTNTDTVDATFAANRNMANILTEEIVGEPYEDFWTQPFLVDHSDEYDYVYGQLMDGVILSPPSHFVGEDFLICLYDELA